MTSEGDQPAAPPQPARVGTPAEFTAALRALRTWSGLTYRQLEGKAAAYQDTLPASTIATTLGRATLPRERFVDAFTRACGLGEDDVREWLETRRRVAMADPEPSPSDEPPASPRWRRLVPLAVAAVVGVVVGVGGTLGAGALSGPELGPEEDMPAIPVTGLSMRVIGSWARLHPVGDPSLCITEGVDRTKRYETAVAAQMPCSIVQPRVFLEPIGKDVVQIQWHHSEYGAVEPAQQFRLERVGNHFRLRPATGDGCLGLRTPQEEGAELVQEDCTGSDTQEFTIELTNPPA